MAKRRRSSGGLDSKPNSSSPAPSDFGNAAGDVARRTVGEALLGASNRFLTLIAVGLLAFSSVFLFVGWQFGPLVILQAQQYKKFTARVDARIVESWLALEFDPKSVVQPSHWRASTNAARCVVVEYGGDWGAALRRGFCGTRVPFNESYLLADLRDIAPGVPFSWPRDERGASIPEIRVDATTREWLLSHVPDKFMHQQWPAENALDWLRLELDRPVDYVVGGWTAPTAIVPLEFDPERPIEALPAGIVSARTSHQPNYIAMIFGLGVGLIVWFKGMALLPLLSGMSPVGRRIWSVLPLLTLPWWMESFPRSMSHFSTDIAGVLGDMFADIGRMDRLVATDPSDATLARGERLVWHLSESVYADTLGRFRWNEPNPRPASETAALAALTEAITTQARSLEEPIRVELFKRLERDKRADLTRVVLVFIPAAKEAANDAAVSDELRRAAKRFLE